MPVTDYITIRGLTEGNQPFQGIGGALTGTVSLDTGIPQDDGETDLSDDTTGSTGDYADLLATLEDMSEKIGDLAYVDEIIDFGFMRVHIKGKMIEYGG